MSGSNENEIVLAVTTGDSSTVMRAFEARIQAAIAEVQTLTDVMGKFGSKTDDSLLLLVKDLSKFQQAAKLNPSLLTPYVAELERAAAATSKLVALEKQRALEAYRTPQKINSARQSEDPNVVQRGINGNANILREQQQRLAQLNAEGASKSKIAGIQKSINASLEREIVLQTQLNKLKAQARDQARLLGAADDYDRVQPALAAARANTNRGRQAAADAAYAASPEGQRSRYVQRTTGGTAGQQAIASDPQAIAVAVDAAVAARNIRDTVAARMPLSATEAARQQIQMEMLKNKSYFTDYSHGATDNHAYDKRSAEVSSANQIDFARQPSNRASQEISATRQKTAQIEEFTLQGGIEDAKKLNIARSKLRDAINSEAIAAREAAAFDATYAKAEREDFTRNPNNRRAATVVATRASAAARTALGADEKYIQARVELAAALKLETAEVKRRMVEQYPETIVPPKPALTQDERVRASIARKDQAHSDAMLEQQIRIEQNNNPKPEDPEAPAPRSLNEVNSAARTRRHDYLFGDGGANLLTTQMAIQANYMALNLVYKAFTDTTTAVLEFDKALYNLQAVSGTTDTEIGGLSKTLLGISKSSTFSATELAKSAEDLAKAGFSLSEIKSLLAASATLAGSTGSELQTSTDVLKGVFTTFNILGSQTGKVLDQVFSALTSSRLTIDKYKEAVADVGVTATQSGLSVAEFNAGLLTLANTGLTNSNQLSQGFRQVFTALQDPSAKFIKKLAEIGLTVKDIDPSIQGFAGSFDNLRNAGFTSADAFENLGARVATTFSALLNNTQAIKDNVKAQLDATGATTAQEKALRSTIDQATILGNSIAALAIKSSGPLKGALSEVASILNVGVEGISHFSGAMTGLVTVLASAAIVAVASRLKNLAVGFYENNAAAISSSAGMNLFNVALGRTVVVEEEGIAVTLGFGAALRSATLAFWPIALLTGVIAGLEYYSTSMSKATQNTEDMQTAENKIRDALDAKGKAIDKVSEFIDVATKKSQSLKEGSDELANTIQEARNQFGELSTGIYDNITSFDSLIAKLVTFRQELRSATGIELFALNKAIQAKADDAKGVVNNLVGQKGVNDLATKLDAGATPSVDSEGMYLPPEQLSRGDAESNIRKKYKSPGAQGAMDYANLKPEDMTQAEALKRITILDQEAKAGAITEAAATSLQDYIRELAGKIGVETKATDDLKRNARTARQTELTGQYSKDGNTQGVINSQKTISGWNLDAIPGGADRRQSFDDMKSQAGPGLAKANAWRLALPKEDQSNFDQSPEGEQLASQNLAMKKAEQAVMGHFDDEVKATLDERVTSLKRDLQLATKELTSNKDPKMTAALAAHAKDVDAAVRDASLQQIDASELSGKGKKSGAQFGAGFTAMERNNKRNVVMDQYQESLDAINNAVTREDGRKPPLDPNRATPLKPQDYAGSLEGQDAKSQKVTSNQLKENAIPLKETSAFISAAQKNGQFSKATISAAEQRLQDLKIDQESADIDAYLARLDSIDKISSQASAKWKMVNSQIDALTNKYHLKTDGQGNISGDFGTGAGGEAIHNEVLKQYSHLTAQRDKLGGSDGSGGLVGKLGAQQTSVQTSADTLIAERNARQQSSTFDAAGGFQDASQLFDKTHGLSKDSSTQKEYTDDLTSMFDKTSSSFSNMIQAMVVGGAKGKNAFKDFALSILQNALQVATNKAAEQMLSGMLSLGGSMFGPSVAAGSGGVGGIAGGVAGDVGGFGLGAAGAYQGKVFPKHFDAGGVVSGTAIGRDSVHALIAPGEAILNRSAVSLVGADQINQINAGSLRQNQSVPQVPPPREPDKVNVYVVDKNTTPTLGKKDVLAAVSEDVLAGGATKKLIQQVAMGSR